MTTHYRNPLHCWGAYHRKSAWISLKRLWRQPLASLLTVLLIGTVLALPTLLGLLLHNGAVLSNHWQNSQKMTLYLSKNVHATRAEQLMSQLKEQTHDIHTRYISPEAGLVAFEKQMGLTHVLDHLPANPLPGVIEVTPTHFSHTSAQFNTLMQVATRLPGVEAVKWDLAWVKRLQYLVDFINRLVGVLTLLFALTVLLVIGNAITLAIQQRRQDIQVADLIGATQGFIRRPFLYTGFFYGLFGAIVSGCLTALIIAWLRTPIIHLAQSYHSDFQLQGLSIGRTILLLLQGAILGIAGAWFATSLSIKQARTAMKT